MTDFLLIHSPLVGPATWSALAPELVRRGHRVLTPDLDGDERDTTPLWSQHASRGANALRAIGDAPVIVGHSGAGVLLPVMRELARVPVAAQIFVDAGLPMAGPRKGESALAKRLDELHAQGRRFPEWTDEILRDVIPDAARRREVIAELRPQPPRFWDESIPVPPRWQDAACAYLRFTPNPAYDDAAAEARQRGWPYREIAGGHFHMLVDPVGVADALLSLVAESASFGGDRG